MDRLRETLDTIHALRDSRVTAEAQIGIHVYRGLLRMHALREHAMQQLRNGLSDIIRDMERDIELHLGQTLGDLAGVVINTGDDDAPDMDLLMQIFEENPNDFLGETMDQSHVELNAPPETEAEKEDTCPICYDTISLRETVRRLKCDHVYHKKCIDPWLRRKFTCPMCRADV